MSIKVHKLNESYSVIDSDQKILHNIFEYLKIERPGAYFDPLVKAGFKSPYEYFASVQHDKLLVLNGHLQLLSQFGINTEKQLSDYSEQELVNFLNEIYTILPFKPHDFQEKAFIESVLNVKQICKMATSSGKSLTISLIADFFRKQNKKGLLLVPNINLLTQFKNDINEYNLTELYNNTHIIGGGNSDKNFNSALTISTWQSLQNWKDDLDKLDYIITDECLEEDTMITTKYGKKEIKNIKVGEEVLTINEETKLFEYKPVIKVHKNLSISSKEKMFELKLENGQSLKITGNHKLLTQRGWIRADELTIKDEIINE